MAAIDPEVKTLARLEVARDIYAHYAEFSETCWVLSIAAGAAGIVAAVASARQARHWDGIVRDLERELLLLRVERRMTGLPG